MSPTCATSCPSSLPFMFTTTNFVSTSCVAACPVGYLPATVVSGDDNNGKSYCALSTTAAQVMYGMTGAPAPGSTPFFSTLANTYALNNGGQSGCVQLTIVAPSVSQYTQPVSGLCTDVWTFNLNPNGPHNVSETCELIPGSTFMYSVTVGTFNGLRSVVFRTVDRDTVGSVYTWTQGCAAPVLSSFVGTWISDTGMCASFTPSNTFPNQASILATAGSTGVPMWPSAALLATLGAPSQYDAMPTNSLCSIQFNFGMVQNSYALTCSNRTYQGAMFLGMNGLTPSSLGSGGYGSSWYFQHYVKSNINNPAQLQVVSSLFDYGQFPFVFNITTSVANPSSNSTNSTQTFTRFTFGAYRLTGTLLPIAIFAHRVNTNTVVRVVCPYVPPTRPRHVLQRRRSH